MQILQDTGSPQLDLHLPSKSLRRGICPLQCTVQLSSTRTPWSWQVSAQLALHQPFLLLNFS